MKKCIFLLTLMLALAALSWAAADLPVLVSDGRPVGTLFCYSTIEDGSLFVGGGDVRTDQLPTVRAGGKELTVLLCSRQPDTGLVLLVTEPAGDTAAAEVLPQAAAGDLVRVTGLDANGSECSAEVTAAAPVTIGDWQGFTVSAVPGLLPGAVVTDAQGRVAAVISAAWSENPGRYLAWAPQGIVEAFVRQEGGSVGFEDITAPAAAFTLSAEDGVLHLHLDGEDPGDLYMIVADLANYYESRVNIRNGDFAAQYPVTPGATYACYLRHRDDPEMTEADFANPDSLWTAPAAGVFTAYDYAEKDVWVTVASPDAAFADTEAVPDSGVPTVYAIEDGTVKVWVQATSTYSVVEETSVNTVFVLTSPAGCHYNALGTFTFMPSLAGGDSWHLDITSLFEDALAFDDLEPGAWNLSWYFEGEKAGGADFTMEPGEADSNAKVARVGVPLRHFTAKAMGDGRVMLDYSEWALPEGLSGSAYWDVTAGYGRNQQLVSYRIEPERFSGYLPSIPGERMMIWVTLMEPDTIAPLCTESNGVTINVPSANKLTRFGYREEDVWVTMTGGTYEATEQIPAQPVTLSGLQAGQHLYLQITSLYETPVDVEDVLIYVITDPQGFSLPEMTGYLYMGGLNPDVWNMDITEDFQYMLENTMQHGSAVGTWHIRWYYGGELAGEVDFDVGI